MLMKQGSEMKKSKHTFSNHWNCSSWW